MKRSEAGLANNYINHVAFILDGSGSMRGLIDTVIKVTDEEIRHLASRSKELDQETRVSIYSFGYSRDIKCLVYDKDVLRLPSIKGLYECNGGMTALIDATMKGIEDLEKTPELYGEHAFLVYVLTDGAENDSNATPADLVRRLSRLNDNWTLAAFVPNAIGVHEAKKFGFPKDNISIWDATSQRGVEEVGRNIRRATETFMSSRALGVRGHRNLFKVDVDNVNASSLRSLERLGPGEFRFLDGMKEKEWISDFIERKLKRAYNRGEGYYQLTKPEKVQPYKGVAIYDKKAHTVYTGDGARRLLGLNIGYEVKIAPAEHPNYDIFIQSTSTNRNLVRGTRLLVVS